MELDWYSLLHRHPLPRATNLGPIPLARSNRGFATFQVEIASHWYTRGNGPGNNYAKFLYCFIGFDALSFMWGEFHRLQPEVGIRYRNLISRYEQDEVSTILTTPAESIRYFSQRPIQNMKARSIHNRFTPSIREGLDRMRILADESQVPEVRLQALGQILYQVRNNLAHGSKGAYGDDDRILKNAVPPMRCFLEIALRETELRIP